MKSQHQAALGLLLAVAILAGPAVVLAASTDKPNIVIVFTDDQGYGDLGCFGSQTIDTPRIDRLATEGTRFTSFYAQPVCGPSRAALNTARYPVRTGNGWSVSGKEVTTAEVLKEAGYTTCCLGKWDMSGRRPVLDRMPNAQGFDYYFGTLGANDRGHVRFYENNNPAGETSDMACLTRMYTDKGIDFIKKHKDGPFFLYLAHNMAHSVIGASKEYHGKSKDGLYGDVIEEIDFQTGRLLDVLDELGLSKNTIVVFTTDNGPWSNAKESMRRRNNGNIAWGSAGPLREAKGSTYEGGLRVPCLIRWPGHVPAGRTNDAIFSTLDILPTLAHLGGGKVPEGRTLDGTDQTDLLLGKSETGAREDFYYFSKGSLHGVRVGKWKLLLAERPETYGYVDDKGPGVDELFDLSTDMGEQRNLAEQYPEIVERLKKRMNDNWSEFLQKRKEEQAKKAKNKKK